MDGDAIRAMERLREARGVRARDLSIGDQLAGIRSRVVVADRAMVRVDEAWGRLVEPGLRARAAVVGLRNGVLRVRTGDAAARYALERWLAGGGQERLAREGRVAINRVRFESGGMLDRSVLDADTRGCRKDS